MSYKQSIFLAVFAALLLIGCVTVAANNLIEDAPGRSAVGYGSGGYGSGGYGNVGHAPSSDSYKKLVQDTQEFQNAYIIEFDRMIEKIEAIHEKAEHKKDKWRNTNPQGSYRYAYDPNA
uniref:Putative secreted protein n=1 Tax=Anopheles aquasalis TaxID=42839 RepID=T1E8B5_ANOAQ